MPRSVRRSRKLEATKEFFEHFEHGDDRGIYGIGNTIWAGWNLTSSGVNAYGKFYLPWDFVELEELDFVFIPLAEVAEMRMLVQTGWATVTGEKGFGSGCGEDHSEIIGFNTTGRVSLLTEVSIKNLLKRPSHPKPTIAPRTYVAVMVTRDDATLANNTNLMALGVKVRYNTPIY